MKKKLLFLVASFGLFAPMTAKLPSATTMFVEQNDGTVDKYNIKDVAKVYYNDRIIDGHEYVDLGLPSGLKWATMNVGATEKYNYGNYYAWGEVTTSYNYSFENCKAYEYASELEASGVIDANGNLTAEYDAATVNWGENWRMPTIAEWEELLDNCTWTWTSLGGENGYKVASKATDNHNWIFLPAAGFCDHTYCGALGWDGIYWSSTVRGGTSTFAYYLSFVSSSKDTEFSYLYIGHSVRPVCK